MSLKKPFRIIIPDGSNGYSYIVDANGIEIGTNYHSANDFAEPKEVCELLNAPEIASTLLDAYRLVLKDTIKRS